MEPVGTLVSLVAVALAKRVGGALLDDHVAEGVARDVLGDLLGGASGQLGGALGKLAEGLPIRRVSLRRLRESTDPVDLAGAAWAEALSLRADADVSVAFDGLGAAEVRKRLDSLWFVERLTSAEGRELGAALVTRGGGVASLSALLQDAAERELDLDEAPAHDLRAALFTSLVGELPDRLGKLLRKIPSVQASLDRAVAARTDAAAHETLGVVQRLAASLGNTERDQRIAAALHRHATALSAGLDADVFQRTDGAELPLQPLRQRYVEPHARRRAAGDQGWTAASPALQALDAAWEASELVVLTAPFGMGKSLTCRMVAGHAAERFLAGASGTAPLLMSWPELLGGTAASLRDGLMRHLRSELALNTSEVDHLLDSLPLLVILDSFDEVVRSDQDMKRFLADAGELARRRGLRVLVASRPYALEERWVDGQAQVLELQRFDEAQGDQWLAAHQALHDGALRWAQVADRLDEELAGTPILLLMAAWSWSESSLAVGRAALYRSFLDRVARGKWLALQDRPHPRVEASEGDRGAAWFREALQRLGWWHLAEVGLLGDDQQGLPLSRVRDRLRAWLPELAEREVNQLVGSLAISLFLTPDEQGHVRFSHRSFREALCAEHIEARARADLAHGARGALTLALSEVQLGIEEVLLAAELIGGWTEPEHARLLHRLDVEARDPNMLLVGHVRAHTWHGDTPVYEPDAGADRRPLTRRNAEALAAAIRGLTAALRRTLRCQTRPAGTLAMAAWENRSAAETLAPRPQPVAYRREDGALFMLDRPSWSTGWAVNATATGPVERFVDGSTPWIRVAEMAVFHVWADGGLDVERLCALGEALRAHGAALLEPMVGCGPTGWVWCVRPASQPGPEGLWLGGAAQVVADPRRGGGRASPSDEALVLAASGLAQISWDDALLALRSRAGR